MTKTVLVTDYAWPSLDIEREVFAEAGAELLVAETGIEDELVGLAPRADAILTCFQKVTAAVLEAAPHCCTVARYGVGVDNIDVARATELGMVVSNVPDYCVDEVSDHTAALILALTRRVVPFARQVADGGWDSTAFPPMRRLRGQTLGLVGFGAIARRVATKMRGFGMQVLAYSPGLHAGEQTDEVIAAGSLAEVLARSDVLSLHVPLNEGTRGLIDAEALSRMKPSALLINTARGPLVDTTALAGALAAGRLAGAALDVLPHEPPAPDEPLLGMDNVILTPHAAFASLEAVAELQNKAATNVAAVLAGRRPRYVVNPGVYRDPADVAVRS
ncbi:MAG: D-3-phosphoglycerate dehydrogenase / 2-oxoglutarate reductase [Actinomycetota bacterium]|jgi:D-3-phosphoglycerate dehydrogenase|nr:D-3-phosphoglycerate dehydrogenase / 2-oxoglutarate reductase [Actinomycetota bacterium]